MQQLRVEYLQPPEPIEEQVDTRMLARRALQSIGLLGVLGLIAAFAPGLGEVRCEARRRGRDWLAAAVVLEGLSCASYVVMFNRSSASG